MTEETRLRLREKLNKALREEKDIRENSSTVSNVSIQPKTTIEKLDAAFRTPEFAMSVYKFLVTAGQIKPKESDEEVEKYFRKELK